MAHRGRTREDLLQKQLLVPLLTLLFSLSSSSTALGAPPGSKPRATVAPISKDPLTDLYTIPLAGNSNFLLDLAGPLLWSANCPRRHPTIPCGAASCVASRAFLCPSAGRAGGHRYPCACSAGVVNPVTGSCSAADLTLSNVTVSATDGRNPTGEVSIPGFISACAPPESLRSLPAGAVGVAGLARSGLSVPSQLASRLGIKRQFALCLPGGETSPGVAFFGDKPFYLLPPTQLEVTSLLGYTALRTSRANPGYYFPLQRIAVNGRAVGLPKRALVLDPLGRGGARLSTATPYTALRTDVYRPFLRAYAEATAGIPRGQKVAPFELCLNSSAMGFTRVGYAVPQVDLMLEGGKNWTVFGANSFKQVGEETACLAFVEAKGNEAAAVVVGGFQMENNFLLFDVGRSRLGFSSTLFFFRTTCGNFNFTASP